MLLAPHMEAVQLLLLGAKAAGRELDCIPASGAFRSDLHIAPCRWLVGRSYRVIYRRDPRPGRANHAVMHSLVHVHGAIHIASDRALPVEQPSGARTHGGCEGDHAFERYAEAMYAAVDRHLEEMAAFRGELHRQALGAGCIRISSRAAHQVANMRGEVAWGVGKSSAALYRAQ